MILDFLYTIIYTPLYNALIFLLDIIPNADIGIAVILLTLIVKFALYPLAKQAVTMQAQVKEVQPKIDAIKKEFKDDKQKQTIAIMDLYKENNIRPFSSIAVILIQIPVIFSLYYIFFRGGLPEINTDIMYSFIPVPETLSIHFLGLIDVTGKSVILAFFAGLTQFIHGNMTIKPKGNFKKGENIKDDLAYSFQMQMKYMMPVLIGGFAYFISAAIALYFITSNIFTIFQELVVRKERDKK